MDGLVGAAGQAFGEGGLLGGVDGEVVTGFVGGPVGEVLDLNGVVSACGWESSVGVGPSSFDSAVLFFSRSKRVPESGPRDRWGVRGDRVGAGSCEVTWGRQLSRCSLRTVLGPRRWCPR
jgi:hypothetical protein